MFRAGPQWMPCKKDVVIVSFKLLIARHEYYRKKDVKIFKKN